MRKSRAVRCVVIGVVALLSIAGTAVAEDVVIDLGRGPVTIFVPASYDPGVPMPLVLLLHGYSSTGALQEAYIAHPASG